MKNKKLLYKISFSLLLLLTSMLRQATAQDIISKGGTLSVNIENSGGSGAGEGSLKVVDNNVSTKFLIFNFSPPLLIQWKCNEAAVAAQYTLTSGDDADERDPRNWTLQGSNNGTTWTTLDTRVSQTFTGRTQTRTFDISNPASYLYYRLNISELSGGTSGLYQMAEWRLLEGLPPSNAPTTLAARAISGSTVNLTFNNSNNNQSGFDIQRSTDAINYTSVGTATTTAYLDASALPNTAYYYRVRAVNKFGGSAFSNIATVSTLNFGGELIDITNDGGVLSVQYEYSGGATGGEGSLKLIDNDYNSKYLHGNSAPYWVIYKATSLRVLTSYAITSGNDAQGRDPKSWTLQASNDSVSWTTLDTRADQVFVGRNLTRTFTANNASSATYRYYKWNVTANYEPSISQISELELFGLDPSAPMPPSNLDITGVTVTSASIQWNAATVEGTGYEIQRSIYDAGAFDSLTTLNPGITSYTDNSVQGGTPYFYRVRSLGATANSVWSNIADSTTDYDPELPLTPRSTTAVATSDTSISIDWLDVSENETGFTVERSSDGTNFTVLDTLAVNTTNFIDSVGLTKATRYYYRVRAFNNKGTSYYTNIANAVTNGQNNAPTLDELADVTTCNTSLQRIPLTGVTTGGESWQTTTVSVSTDKDASFSTLEIVTDAAGEQFLEYAVVRNADNASITIKVEDNGGTLNGGSNTFERSFAVNITPYNVAVVSNIGNSITRYAIAVLTASGASTYEWQQMPGIIGGQGTAALSVKPTLNTTYKVIGSTPEGCVDSASVTISFSGNKLVEPANIITPNGDGKNDRWVIWNILTYTGNQVKILDRSGRLVYSKQNYTNDWDGTYNGSPLEQGTYYYIIDLGSGFPPIKGTLSIIRK